MRRRVVVTGMAGLSPLGGDWPTIRAGLLAKRSGVRVMPEWDGYEGRFWVSRPKTNEPDSGNDGQCYGDRHTYRGAKPSAARIGFERLDCVSCGCNCLR